MLTGCINGMKSEENRYFSLKTSKLTAYLHMFGLSFTWVCSVKALLLPANLNAIGRKTCVKKDWKVRNFSQHNDTQGITKQPHISHIYSKQGCCLQIRQRWRGVCQEKGQLKFCFEHGRFGSIWWNSYGVVGAWWRAECVELRLYVWPIFWCVSIVTCRNLPQRKMPLNYWLSSMAKSINK